MFIMLDGIDGSGKSTVMEAWKKYLLNEGNAIFDLRDYWKKKGTYPNYAELKSYDFIFSCEPSYAEVGKTIREELIKNGTFYPAEAVAEAYSLDRLILYHKIIIPALSEGKFIIQDRGISSSLAYQPLMDKKLTAKSLSLLPGNALALKYRPDYLILLSIEAEVAALRLQKRTGKQDNVIFEKLAFQKKLADVFASKSYSKLFQKIGTKTFYLPTAEVADIMEKEAIQLLKSLLQNS